MPAIENQFIRLWGVRQNNLKGFDIEFPLGELIVVTGLSGAGKSSLVFESLHAEGQRRYVETFSAYTRQFLDMLDRPQVDQVENIRPSIAIEQSNTVRTSRSTVGTMTELTEFFKVWFCHRARLFDPETGTEIRDDNPQSIWKQVLKAHRGQRVMPAFAVDRPEKLSWAEITGPLLAQGYSRASIPERGIQRLDTLEGDPPSGDRLFVIQDRLLVESRQRARFIEATLTALHFGQGLMHLLDESGTPTGRYAEGFVNPRTGEKHRAPQPHLFSFNSPAGACVRCRGFGRVIGIDEGLVIPDPSLTLAGGAIRPFQGSVYGASQKDLMRAARQNGIPTDRPWRELSDEQRAFVWGGEPGFREESGGQPQGWYGVRNFFRWLEGNTYKMHVRVFLSRYRAYTTCPECGGARLRPEALNWKWEGYTLPSLYRMPVGELLELLHRRGAASTGDRQADLATGSILTRLGYLDQVGLGYLTLDRTSRTLSGGEVERVNLTSCLGTSLVDTLFVLDEPSIGLHARDISRLTGILRRLTELGNTVVVVEHDESIMRAADRIIEIGPRPGDDGGNVTFSGTFAELQSHDHSTTGAYLTGRDSITPPKERRPVERRGPGRSAGIASPALRIEGATLHNLDGLSVEIPLQRLVCLSGVSGSGKSTLLDNVIYQGLMSRRGQAMADPARIGRLTSDLAISEVIRVDPSPVSKTPRSNAALFAGIWDEVRRHLASTEAAQAAALTPSHFSFNHQGGRCALCEGLGQERVEMQFMADVFVTCPTCDGKRFKPEILAITWNGKSVDQILAMTVDQARTFFRGERRIVSPLDTLASAGLGYLPLGQPLNTLSGGESQRLKLVKYLSGRAGPTEGGHHLLLLDEPTTGLHRDDVKRLLTVLQQLVDQGHSVVVIEHQLDLLRAADWIIELGPGAGREGGRLVFSGTPEELLQATTETSPFLRQEVERDAAFGLNPPEVRQWEQPAKGRRRPAPPRKPAPDVASQGLEALTSSGADAGSSLALAAEPSAPFGADSRRGLQIFGAREHNLKNLSLEIPYGQFTVVTGVSGSGKSTLAFDIVFAEGQRRFMESMSPYARQFVEQLPRPDVDRIAGIPPTVAIEQRVTQGSGKSTVATVTEVAQYLRLLYARVGIQHSPASGKPVEALDPERLRQLLDRRLRDLGRLRDAATESVHLCAPLVRGRKGHHQPLAEWASAHGYRLLRTDGALQDTAHFQRLDRYREHDVDVVIFSGQPASAKDRKRFTNGLDEVLRLGRGNALLVDGTGRETAWFSTRRTDPDTGEAFPDLDPKHFSWNSARGWCPTCRGHGALYAWMVGHEDYTEVHRVKAQGELCPDCRGQRLNRMVRAVRIPVRDGRRPNLPELLAQTPDQLIDTLKALDLDRRGQAIVKEVIPEVESRLQFMDQVGLGYLTLDRAATTLSGGEAQRIRLASQLGSTLCGVLYVLDEPSIGLHARDNSRLLEALEQLRDKGNTLLVVEHDDDTMERADRIIDLGPAAGKQGGAIMAEGSPAEVLHHPDSLTGRFLREGITHPLRGQYRPLPAPFESRRPATHNGWLVLCEPRLRNLKGGELRFAAERLNVVCGISGAGKSTLVRDLLKPCVEAAVQKKLRRLGPSGVDLTGTGGSGRARKPFRQLIGGHAFRQVIEVDQSPIGKTPRSTPATYVGAFDIIREFFASTPEARLHGFGSGTFSFNTAGGRCETCKGAGRIKLEMNFMPDAYVPCEDCEGSRYGAELAGIHWNGRSIADVLAMTFSEAAEFFGFHTRLKAMMELMVETGLGYLELGQSSPTLSGGEAQRLKLVSELARGLETWKETSRGEQRKNLYLLEEPTIGLHQSDCERLIRLLHRLVDQGHTVIVIEHHLDIIAEADCLIEIGLEGGEAGGEILYQGPVNGLLAAGPSPTAPFLAERLRRFGSGRRHSA